MRLFGLLLLILAMPARAAELTATQVAPGVYAILLPPSDPSPANLGRVVNTGFIVGTDGVVVIDSGANRRHGDAILATVRSVTDKPVRWLINTHPHPQNVLGNIAFPRQGLTIFASAVTREKMGERCPRCLKTLTVSVGAAAMRGTQIRLPNRTVAHGERIEIAGRPLRFLQFGHGHTESDLTVLDEASGVLFSGDLVYRDQIPHLAEADTRGWLVALEGLTAIDFRTLVPGRGPVGDAGAIVVMQRYLSQLRTRVREAYDKGQSADEAIAYADLPEFSAWEGYAQRHGVNVQRVYFEIEREDFAGESRP